MVYLKDTEGDPLLITNLDGKQTWESYISPDYDYDNKIYTGSFSVMVSIPEYLTDGEIECSSCGLLYANMREVFDEYLKDVWINDGGESLELFSKFLREYADKADVISKEYKEAE